MVTTVRKSRDTLLTKRERAILALVGRGMTNQEIADQLWISMRTVKCILHRACVKLGARTRDQAVIQALRQRAIGIHEIFSVDELAEFLASTPPELIAKIGERVKQNYRQDQIQANDQLASASPVSVGSVSEDRCRACSL